jgi:L-threonylcarbamoyladenylate synthase
LPTDTVYGLGVDPHNETAVTRLYELKGRPESRPIGILVGSVEQAAVVGDMSGAAADLAAEHWPGALTLVVATRVVLPDWVGDRHKRTVGLRMPDHPVALELLQATGPLSVTSANLTGEPDTTSDTEARAVFGDEVYYVSGVSPGGQPSTVVDLTGVHPVVLREGPVDITN